MRVGLFLDGAGRVGDSIPRDRCPAMLKPRNENAIAQTVSPAITGRRPDMPSPRELPATPNGACLVAGISAEAKAIEAMPALRPPEVFATPAWFTTADRNGRIAIEWGGCGVPEAFVESLHGIIRRTRVGAIEHAALQNEIAARVRELDHDEG